tara:strand:+ start:69 stop:620 length:552 start_codon:yes stop_codon:yes gene_type:complete
MSQSTLISIVLAVLIIAIFLIDYLKKRKEDSLEKSVEKFVDKESETKERSGVLNWILKRKKNITFFVILVSTAKLFLNYFVYPIYLISTYPDNYYDLDTDNETWYKSICEKYDIVILHNPERISAGWKHNVDKFYDNGYNRAFPADFSVHLENIFSYDLFLFLPCSIFFLILVWIFNDKIKAQ